MSERLEKQAGQPEHLLEVRELKQYFPIHTGWFQNTPLKAVDGVSFTIDAGETLGLVGESRLRQDHRWTEPSAPVQAHRRRSDLQRRSHYAEKHCPIPEGNADRLSGSLLFPESPHDGQRHRRRAAGHPPSVCQQKGAG